MTQEEIYQNFKTVSKLRKELNKETDRGCCLMAVSYIDSILEKLLRRKLIGNKKHKDNLFNANGSLNTLSSKINLSYSIGLLSKTAMTDLNIVRKIRNEFGHSFEIIDFKTDKIKDEIAKIKSSMYNGDEIRDIEPRRIFVNAVSGIVGEIHSTLTFDPEFVEKTNTIVDNTDAKNMIKQLSQNLWSTVENAQAEGAIFPDEDIARILLDHLNKVTDKRST
ncbi:MltR family transcriptional regulator [Spirosoma aerolatum]|uniref:MltR family transcriptional regulator n=1 Tax=Spirosoma aerolatum TaxID=1211326 RepID=UPI0009AC06BE|nr:MltR family transcriptional regulator [Spirosoma aerolatum]